MKFKHTQNFNPKIYSSTDCLCVSEGVIGHTVSTSPVPVRVTKSCNNICTLTSEAVVKVRGVVQPHTCLNPFTGRESDPTFLKVHQAIV